MQCKPGGCAGGWVGDTYIQAMRGLLYQEEWAKAVAAAGATASDGEMPWFGVQTSIGKRHGRTLSFAELGLGSALPAYGDVSLELEALN